ncbi:S6 family peptidase [Campylobacter vicugnae]|uniref:S6 family peptidase n=1 Tax=Campylobacter vicugnae TaxID=1660076 RepID=UPI000A345E9A|nr:MULTISPECIES: S6 family peptidase [unclassified Campylobacter]
MIKIHNKIGLSIALSSVLVTCNYAQIMYLDKNYYRDFIDLGQNKGVFSTPNQSVNLKQKDGNTFTFAKIPDQSARSNHGAVTSLGRNYVTTAKHLERIFEGKNTSELKGKFDLTTYNFLSGQQNTTDTKKQYGRDTIFLRTDKYIVEGEIDPLEIDGLEVSTKITDYQSAQKNIKLLDEYIKNIQKSDANPNDNNVDVYQAGTGTLGFRRGNGGQEARNLQNSTRGGGINYISLNNISSYKQGRNNANGLENGIVLNVYQNKNFENTPSTGDSGSGLFVYDTTKNKWVLVGVVSMGSSTTEYSIVTKTDFDDYKKQYENEISKSSIENTDLKKDKDNIVSNSVGGTITLNSELDLGTGGIVVKQGNWSLKSDPANTGKIKNIAGFDIQDGSLNLEVASLVDIHKIGSGVLNVSSTNENLRLGNGEVILKNANAFKKIYITSGRGTLKLDADNIDLNDKIFFSNGGGKLDLNGKSQTFSNVSANANNAKIINSSSTKSTLTIKNDDKDKIFHASIGESGQNNQIDITTNGSKVLVFDGGFDINGKFSANGGTIVLQGHPTTHALGDNSENKDPSDVRYKGRKNIEIIKSVETQPDYMDLTRPSTLAQPDWDTREFKAKKGIEVTNTKLHVGRNAEVTANITANQSSEVVFGGDKIKHYIDKFDGANTTGDGFTHQQEISSEVLKEQNRADDTIKFSGSISADSSKITSNAKNFNPTSITLKNQSSLNASDLEISDKSSIKLENYSTAVVKNLNINGDNSRIKKDDTSHFQAESFTLTEAKNFQIDNILKGSKIDKTKIINSNANGSDISNTNLELEKSTLTLTGKLELSNQASNLYMNGGELKLKDLTTQHTTKVDITAKNGAKIATDNEISFSNATKMTANINLDNAELKASTIKSENTELTINKTDKSKFDITTLQALKNSNVMINSNDELEFNLDAQNGSNITLNKHKLTNANTLKSDESSYLNFGTLTYDASNHNNIKDVDANVRITNLLDIKTDKNAREVNRAEIDFKKILELSSGSRVQIDFSKFIQKDDVTTDPNKEYEILKAGTLTNNGVTFKAIDPNGLFSTFEVKDNKLYVKFSERNLKDVNELSKATGLTNQNDKKILSAILSSTSSSDQDMIDNAARSGNVKALKERVEKIEGDLKAMAQNTVILNTKALYANNEMISTRLSQLNYFRANADISQFKLAGLESDSQPSLKLVLDAMEQQRLKNNFWANINGGYFKEKDTNGELKFHGANFGYDQNIEGTELTLGLMMGFTKSNYEARNFKDDSKIYNFGAYSFYNGEKFEIQNNLNLAFIRGDRYIADSQKANVKSTGLLSSNYLKYKIDLKDDTNFKHTLKPLVVLDLGLNGIKGFNNNEYKQKDFNDFNVAVGIGAEYAISSQSSSYAAQFIAKQNIYHSKDKAFVTLNNSNEYIGYDIDKNNLNFKLNLLGQKKLNENFALAYEVGGMVDKNGNHGVSGSLKLEYKF